MMPATDSRRRIDSEIVDLDLDADRKAWTTIAARLALRGFQAWRSNPSDGAIRYFVSRWGHGRDFVDLASVERFAEQAGA